LKYILGIEPKAVGKALLFGTAWHKAIEVYYDTNGDAVQSLRAGIKSLEDAETKFQYSDDYNEAVSKLGVMFAYWLENIGPQILREYSVISTEQTLEMTLSNGLKFSGRLDEILERKSDYAIFVGEHKSTSYSLGVMEKSVDESDQVTGYEVLVKENLPSMAGRFTGTLLDTTYSRNGKTVEGRVIEVHRTQLDCSRFIIELNGITTEIAQKAAAFVGGTHEALLFPRNGSHCSQWPCPYEAICRQRVTRSYPLPDSLEYAVREKSSIEVLGIPS
jgi:hypothetical protein